MKPRLDCQQILANFRYDFPASIVVFLVALPLCLGIALASDAPLFSGILTGIIGGIVVGALSGSQVSVSGPAAGLTVIVAGGIASLGGFEAFLCAVFLAGLIQIGFGLLRGGFLATLFPNAVIKGMLAAIGLTIILKQIPHAFGGFGHFESDMGFWQLFGSDPTWNVLKAALSGLSPAAFLICCLSILILVTWESKPVKSHPYLSRVPGPLVAVFTAALINQLFHMNFPDLALRAEDGRLVTLPEISSLGALVGELRRPDFSLLTSGAVWMLAFTLAAVASIETLLCIESTDKLDPQKRISNTNRELFAQGVGNMLAGLVGGLPMTSVIVRSSANIYAQARTRMSTIYHGCFLLLSALAMASILNLIPLAALAAVLISVGYKLAHPKLFKSLYTQGMNQFVPFAVTIIAILFTDLLKGVLIGLAVGVLFVIKASFYSAILTIRDGKDILIRFTKDATFIHKIKLRRDLGLVERGDHVFFDGSRAMYIDHDVYEMIQHFVDTAPDRGITVELKDVQVRRPQVNLAKWEKRENGVLQEAVVGQPRLGS